MHVTHVWQKIKVQSANENGISHSLSWMEARYQQLKDLYGFFLVAHNCFLFMEIWTDRY